MKTRFALAALALAATATIPSAVVADESLEGKATIEAKLKDKKVTIVIKGKDIQIEGSGKINVKASSDVVIKGSKVGIN